MPDAPSDAHDAFGRTNDSSTLPGWGPPPSTPAAPPSASVPPPGQAFASPVAEPPAAIAQDRPHRLGGLARVLLALLALGILADAAGAITGVDQLGVLDRLVSGEDVPGGEIDASDNRYALVGGLQSFAVLGTVVLWLIWFRRAYHNVERLAPGGTRFGHGWAIGAWFVPFLNLWRPKQIANDIYRSGATDTAAGIPFRERGVDPWLHVWWGLWILTSVLGRVGLGNVFGAETLKQQRDSDAATIGSDATSVLAGMAAFYVVLTLTRRQDRAAGFVD